MARGFDEERIDRVERLLAAGSPAPYVRKLLTKEYGCSGGMVSRLIAEVHRRWEARAADMSPDDWRTRLTAMALERYRTAVEKGHESTADRCINTIARLNGVGASHVSSIVNVYDRGGAAGLGQAITDEVRKLRAQQALTDGTDDDKGSGGERN